MKGSSKVMLGFLAGIAAGVGIYSALQTDKGKKIMNEVKKQADDIACSAKKLLQRTKNGAEAVADEAKA